MKQKRRKMPIDKDYLEYANKLPPAERQWVKQFYDEYYRAQRPAEPIINDPEMIKEANRVHNANYSYDLYSIVEREGLLKEFSSGDHEQFMRDASDDWEWENIYKQQGYANAIKEIFYQAERDLNNSLIPFQITLARFLCKFMQLKRLNNRRGEVK